MDSSSSGIIFKALKCQEYRDTFVSAAAPTNTTSTTGGGASGDVILSRCENCKETFPCEMFLKVHTHEHVLPSVQQVLFNFSREKRKSVCGNKNRLLSISYDCQICDSKYGTRELLLQHCNGHLHGHNCQNKECQRIYQRSYGPESNSNNQQQLKLNQHKEVNVKETRNPCQRTNCPADGNGDVLHSTKNNSEIKRIRNSPEFKFSSLQPTNCGGSNSNSSMVKGQRKRYQCAICKKLLSSKLSHDEHYRKHTGETPYCCKYCGKCYAVKNTFRQHVATHKQLMMVGTYHSKISDTHQIQQQQQQKQIQQKQNELLKTGNRYSSSKCPICCGSIRNSNSSGSNSKDYHHHTCPPMSKRGESFRCKICGKLFARREWRTKHYLSHDGGESCFRCEVCGEIFPDEQFYLIHAQAHVNADVKKTFLNCQICAKTFPGRELYERHSCRFGAVNSSG